MKLKRDPFRVIIMWFLLLIYGAPTVFMIECWLADITPFAWWMLAWGGVACLTALLFGEKRVSA